MQNALLYTFSTIAQSLGGAFALIAAFVLYRFESLDKVVSQNASQLRAILSSHQENNMQWFDTLLAQWSLAELMSEVATALTRVDARVAQGIVNPLHGAETEYVDRFRDGVQIHEGLKKLFRGAAFTTAAVMSLSLTSIPFAPYVFEWTCPSVLMLSVGIGGFLACLYLYWKVIETAIYR
jgi:hypothetical protein